MTQAIALLDCNNFYASCERMFDARLHKKPVVVLSNNDGCIIARSEEAKRIGVTMGAPLFKVENFLFENEAEIFSSNYELYGDMSARVMENLREFTAEVEVYSIDEAFLGLRNDDRTFDFLGREIQEKMYKWTGIPVSIGIAETKVLAKVANRLAKKSEKARGVLDLYKSPYIETALESTPVGDIWGIGRSSRIKLCDKGIFNALELRNAELRWVRKALSVTGARIVTELRGIRALPLDLNPPPKHSITCSRSFGQSVQSINHLKEAVAVFLSRTTEKLRRNNLAANSITVFIGTDRFNAQPEHYSNSATYSSAFPTDVDQELQNWAFGCLEKIYRKGFCYRKAGVMLGGLVPSDKLTERMYDDEGWERFRRTMKAVDEINRKFGRDTIHFCVAQKSEAWRGKANKRSWRYTTRMDEIMIVK